MSVATQTRLVPRALALAAVALLAGCGADTSPTPSEGRVPSVLIVNDSQYTLRELRIHRTEAYASSESVLDAPLPEDGELVYYGDGATYFTVIRERVAAGPLVALTTERSVFLARDQGYRLSVYDQAFRLSSEPYIDPAFTDLPTVGDPEGDARGPTTPAPDASVDRPDGGARPADAGR